MIQTHYVEIRRRRLPGESAPTTIIREVHGQNGRGRKTIRVLRGKRVISDVSELLRPSEKISRPALYKSAEKKTLVKMNKKTRRRAN